MKHFKIMCVWFCMTAMAFAFPATGGAAGWTSQNPLPTENTLRGVWGSSGSDIFAAGDAGTILHYDGNTWSAMTSGTTDTLYGVWGGSGSDVFAVGGYYGKSTILHYSGNTWSEMTSGTTDTLYGVWGSSGSDIFVVGGSYVPRYGPNRGTIGHYDGNEWSEMTSGMTTTLYDVWGNSGSDVFAVGLYGTILHYNGSEWSEMASGTTNTLYGVWGSSSSDVFAVGSFYNWATGSYSYVTLHYDGNTWSEIAGTNVHINSVWGGSGSDVFAVGSSGTIFHYDGSAWSEMASGTTNTLNGVWGGSGSGNVFAVGKGGTILEYDKPVNGTVPVYRFYSEQLKKHFFTRDANEKNTIIATFPVDVWRYEGIAWYVFPDSQNGTLPVYRFYSELLQSHFFTTDENEKDTLIATFTEDVWRYEGVAWYVYPDFQPDSLAVYRFYSELLKVHFYTMDENEKDTIIALFPVDVWRYEGIAYYAYP